MKDYKYCDTMVAIETIHTRRRRLYFYIISEPLLNIIRIIIHVLDIIFSIHCSQYTNDILNNNITNKVYQYINDCMIIYISLTIVSFPLLTYLYSMYK